MSDATCCSVLKGCSGIKRGDAAEPATQSHDFSFFFFLKKSCSCNNRSSNISTVSV